MGNIVFDAALGKAGMFGAAVNLDTATMEILFLEASGLESDAVLRKRLSVDTLLSLGTTNEQTTMGRKVVGPGVGSMAIVDNTVDDTTYVGFASANQTQEWTGDGGNEIGAVVIAHRPAGAGGTDLSLIPVVKLDLSIVPGTDYRISLDFQGYFVECANG